MKLKFNALTFSLIFSSFVLAYCHVSGEPARFKRSTVSIIALPNVQEETQSLAIANLREKLEQQSNRKLSNKTRFEFYGKNSNLNLLLSLNTMTGELKVKRALDRDNICEAYRLCCNTNEIDCPLSFLVKVREDVNIMYLANFTFNLRDRNDNRPIFSRGLMNIHVRENSPPGIRIPLDLARDPDAGINGVREYKIPDLRNHRRIPFTIETVKENGRITQVYLETTERLDREKKAFYVINVEASDGTDSAILKVNVTVDDENDNSPIFLNATFSRKLKENEPTNREIARVKARDEDSGENGMISYSLDSNSLMTPFEVGHQDGIIRLRNSLDHEKDTNYKLTIIAKDKGIPERSATLRVTIDVEDVNDCYPVITVNSESGRSHRYEVAENQVKKVIIATIDVSDEDSGDNGLVDCTFKDTGQLNNFRLETLGATGAYSLVSDRVFDREVQSMFKVAIDCTDRGIDPKSSRKEIDIHVKDMNDNPPVFKQSSYSFHIEENNDIGAEIGNLKATDIDIGRNGRVNYRLQNKQMQQYFHLTSGGMLKAASQFDRERTDNYVLHVIAEDEGEPKQSSTATATVSILDQNDETPNFKGGNSAMHLFVREDIQVNSVIAELSATDADIGSNGRITFKLLNITNSFKVSQDGKLSVIKSLDRETKSFYRLLVEARDHGRAPKSSTATVLVDITDVNDNKPRFIFPTETTAALNISTDFVPGRTITRVVATDLDVNENALIRYRIILQNETFGMSSTATKFLSPTHMFVIEEESGELKLNSPLDPQQFSYMLRIEARDCGEPPLSDSRILLIKVIPASVNQRKMKFIPRNVPGIVMILVAGLAVLVLIVLLLLILFLANKRYSLNRNRAAYRAASKDANHPPSYNDIISDQKGGMVSMSAHSALLSTNNTLNSKNATLMSQGHLHSLSKQHPDDAIDQRAMLLKMDELPISGTLSRYHDKTSTYGPNSYLHTSEMSGNKSDRDQSYCQLHVSNIYQIAEPSMKCSEPVQSPQDFCLPQEAYTSLNPSSAAIAATSQSMALTSSDYSKLGHYKSVPGGNFSKIDTLSKQTSLSSAKGGPKTLRYGYDSISHV